jgi:polyisoprenoid-binding protein YceI/peroxiredoxin
MIGKALLALGMLGSLALSVTAEASGFDFDFKDPKEISAVSLTLDSKLEPIVGYARGISGIINFDPANPQKTTGKIAVDVASVQFANEGYTATARGYALNGDKYPQIFFTLRKVVSGTRVSENEFQGIVEADFTCKGVTLPLTVPVNARYFSGLAEERTNGKFKGDVLVVRTHFAVSRTKLGISEGIPINLVGDSVEIGVACVGIHYQDKPKPSEPGQSPAVISTPKSSETTRDYTLPEIRADRNTGTLNLAHLQGKKSLVLFFFSEQCGVTYFYKQRIQQLQHDFEAKGYVFIGVRAGKREHPNARFDLPELTYLSMPFADDPVGQLVHDFHIGQSVTFVVLDNTGKIQYRGGFDDNVDEKRVQRHYLRDALQSLASGQPVKVKEGKAIGCAIIPLQ